MCRWFSGCSLIQSALELQACALFTAWKLYRPAHHHKTSRFFTKSIQSLAKSKSELFSCPFFLDVLLSASYNFVLSISAKHAYLDTMLASFFIDCDIKLCSTYNILIQLLIICHLKTASNLSFYFSNAVFISFSSLFPGNKDSLNYFLNFFSAL